MISRDLKMTDVRERDLYCPNCSTTLTLIEAYEYHGKCINCSERVFKLSLFEWIKLSILDWKIHQVLIRIKSILRDEYLVNILAVLSVNNTANLCDVGTLIHKKNILGVFKKFLSTIN